MREKETLPCDKEVTKSGETNSKKIFDVTEDNASDAARDQAEGKAREPMAKAIEKIKKKYVCDDEDCSEMVVTRHLDTEVTCKKATQNDPDMGLVENGHRCKATCTWTITVKCE